MPDRNPSPEDLAGLTSPGGFVFGVTGWVWAEPRPVSITFFLDGTARVSDQYGRPIKGAVLDGKEVLFAKTAPSPNDPPGARKHLARHADVVAVLEAEGINWRKLTCAGWPQLPYNALKKSLEGGTLPWWPFSDAHDPTKPVGCTCLSCSIRDPQLRKDTVRIKREDEEIRLKETTAPAEE